jgi:hypothetical protein
LENGAIAQLGERFNGIEEVVGSIPSGSTILTHDFKLLWKVGRPICRARRDRDTKSIPLQGDCAPFLLAIPFKHVDHRQRGPRRSNY